MKDDPSNPFYSFAPPEPPPDLRESAMRAGRSAFAASPVRDRWSRLAGSRVARLAWAASVALLVGLQFVPDRRPAPRAPAAEAPGRADPDVDSAASLPRISEHALSACSGGAS